MIDMKQQYKGLLKRGNNWGIKLNYLGKSQWLNTGIPYGDDTRKEAERYYDKHLKTNRKRNSTIQRLNDRLELINNEKEKIREKSRISFHLEKYLTERKNDPKIKQSTMEHYILAVKSLIAFTDDMYLHKLSHKDMAALTHSLALRMTGYGVDGYLARIRAFLNWVILNDEEDRFMNLPKVVMQMKLLKQGKKKEKRAITKQEYKQVMSFIDDGTLWGDYMVAYLTFANQVGVRLSECLKGTIKGDAWTFVGKRDRVHKRSLNDKQIALWNFITSKLPTDENGLNSPIDIKNLSVRVSKACTRACRQMLLFNNLDFLKRYELEPEDVYGLSNKKIDRLGKRLLYTIYAKEKGTTISRMTLADKREAKTNNVSFNSIRHAWMTKSVKEKGVENTKAIIGHSDIKTTMGYTHMSQYETSKEYIKN